MRAPTHPDQANRLKTLHSYDVLDTPREAEFDEIVALASRICEVPVSLISLVDEDRQWFKAGIGFDGDGTPIEQSVCSHVILEDDFVEITDTLQDPRTVGNALTEGDDGMRFYAGAPLVAPDGLPIGTLCVIDTQPRELNDLQREAIRVLSKQVMIQLELRRALKIQETLLHEADHRVKNSLQTLASVVRLFGRNVKDQAALEAFDAIQRRIESVSALHGELQGSDAGKVNASAFLERVLGLLEESAPDHVAFACLAEDLELPATAASAIGMIVSEFAANSIKHGFPEGNSGLVQVHLQRVEGRIELTCQDNGVGSNGADPDASHSETLGSNLMAAAAAQLGGDLSQDLSEKGSRMVLRF